MMAVSLPTIEEEKNIRPVQIKIEVMKKNLEILEPENTPGEKVKLEFPYDDLALLYEYILKEMGIQDPFK